MPPECSKCGRNHTTDKRCVVRATDRARELWQEVHAVGGCGNCVNCPACVALANASDEMFPAALDFADAVEAAYDESEDSGELISLVIRAHTAFLAQLDRATGGANA